MMAKFGITNGSNENFFGFDNDESALKDSKGRPLFVGDVVKVLLGLNGDHDFEDPEYPNFMSYNKAVVIHNYNALYGNEEEDLLEGWKGIHNSSNGPLPVDGNVVLFDHHITEGEVIYENWLKLHLADLDSIKQYRLYKDNK
jgi:hypothetical protein